MDYCECKAKKKCISTLWLCFSDRARRLDSKSHQQNDKALQSFPDNGYRGHVLHFDLGRAELLGLDGVEPRLHLGSSFGVFTSRRGAGVCFSGNLLLARTYPSPPFFVPTRNTLFSALVE